MKIQKAITFLLFVAVATVAGVQTCRADFIDDAAKINAIATAKARSKVRSFSNSIAPRCETILGEIPSENTAPACEEIRNECQTEVSEQFEAEAEAAIQSCQPSLDEGRTATIDAGVGLDCLQELAAGILNNNCSDNSTPGRECLDAIQFRQIRDAELAEFQNRLSDACQVLPANQPEDNGVEAQEPNLGVAAEDNNIIADQDAPATGGCTLAGTPDTMGIWNLLWLALPMAGLRKRKK